MNLDPLVLLLVVLGTVLIGGVSIMAVRDIWQRLLLAGIFFGLCLYNGVGAAYHDVPRYYLLYYFGFLCAFACAFWFFKVAFVHLSFRTGHMLTRVLNDVDLRFSWRLIIWVYVILHFVPLLYPEFRIQHLFTPPRPDLIASFARQWTSQEMDVLQKLIDYATILLTPFFYIALFRYRKRMSRVVLIFGILLYAKYVANGYIGRSDIGIALVTIYLALWVSRPKWRRRLVAMAMLAFPFILSLSYFYSIIRIGGTPSGISPLEAIALTLEQEISFPRNVGIPIIESDARVDLAGYAKWMVTLPIPKLLTGEIEGARVNYEISEFILGLGRGEPGWYIVLPGLVAESVYIFGRYFFWLHAVFIAFLAALMIRLVERTPQLLFLQAYLVVTFAYHLNRGGITGPMGILVNHFMLFYVFVFIHVFVLFKKEQAGNVLSWTADGCSG